MKTVVDTNIFLAVCLSQGPANAVIAACLKGQAIPLMGTSLFNEYEDVLARATLFQRSRLNSDECSELWIFFSPFVSGHVFIMIGGQI